MTDQLYISDSGSVKAEPLTWDGEPLWSPDTLAESPHLFEPSAFEQMPGQLAIDEHASLMGEAWDAPGGFWENRERNS